MKVKYQGVKYKVSKRDKLKVFWIKFVLFLKRCRRRWVQFISPNGGLYLIIAILWILFGILVYFLGVHYNAPDLYTVWDVIWELKIPFFTSLVLAGVISGYVQLMEYRDKIRSQHALYLDTLGAFDSLFAPFIGEELWYYMPFFNEECVDDTLNYILEYNIAERDYGVDEFKEILTNIIEQLDRIENKVEMNSIIGMHKHDLEDYIKDAKRLIGSKIQKGEENKYEGDELNKIAGLLLCIIADIRRPWRWDIKNDKKILGILGAYKENDIKNDFYYSMHLEGHKLPHEERDT